MEPTGKGPTGSALGRQTKRSETDDVARRMLPHDDRPIVDAVQRVAEARGVPMAAAALAWVLRNPVVTAPIVGATRAHHLADAAAALDLELTNDEVAALEEHYTSRQPTGFR